MRLAHGMSILVAFAYRSISPSRRSIFAAAFSSTNISFTGPSFRFSPTSSLTFLHPKVMLRPMVTTSATSTTDEGTIPIASNLQTVRDKIAAAAQSKSVRLVAVSKTKPITLLQAAYDAGQRYFGENYVQELVEKIPQMDTYAREQQQEQQLPIYHFIGPLQSNKVNMLVNAIAPDVDRLVIETVASIKLANKLQTAVERVADRPCRLGVFVQVNTSQEASKSGLMEAEQVQEVCRHIVEQCPQLELRGLMTIGAVGDTACFDRLVAMRRELSAALGGEEHWSTMELSMGMSGDYEAAIAAGATNVRVGSTIFGARDYSNLA